MDYGERILFLGAHSDDIEIGCGGTAAKLAASGCKITFAVASDSGPERQAEAREAAAKLGLRVEDGGIVFGSIPDRRLDHCKPQLLEWLEALGQKLNPDTVFVHHADNNLDHETVFTVAIRCFNHETILQYFIPQKDARRTQFSPNVTEDISDYMEIKLAMCACHRSQANKGIYLNPDLLKANALVFFMEGNSMPTSSRTGYAEAFRIHALRQMDSNVSNPPDYNLAWTH